MSVHTVNIGNFVTTVIHFLSNHVSDHRVETLQLVVDVTEFKEHLMKDKTFDDLWANIGDFAKASARVSQPGINVCY